MPTNAMISSFYIRDSEVNGLMDAGQVGVKVSRERNMAAGLVCSRSNTEKGSKRGKAGHYMSDRREAKPRASKDINEIKATAVSGSSLT